MSEFTSQRKEFLLRARQIQDYFAKHASNEALFEPERDVTIKIVEIMESGDLTRRGEVQGMLDSLKGTRHYDGSGWLDFQMTVGGWLRSAAGE